MNFGGVTVDQREGYTLTILPDGGEVVARHDEQPGQAETARKYGYDSASSLNRDHDLMHSLLAHWLGLPHSPTLWDISHQVPATDLHAIEEAAVLAIQRFARAMNVNLEALAFITANRTTAEELSQWMRGKP